MPRLIVISLLNHFTENVQIRVEEEFFEHDPETCQAIEGLAG